MRRLLAASLALTLAGTAGADSGRLYLSGSTTLIPIVSNAANAFMDTYETWDQYDPELPDHPILIETSGGGSGQGVRAVLDTVADAGMVSRELRAEEVERLGEHSAVRVGIDAVAVAAHRDNPLHTVRSDLSRDELRDIFSGKTTTYSDFDSELPEREVVLLVRDASAGSAVMIQRQILGETDISPGALQMSSQGQLLRHLAGNSNAFAYISAGLVNANEELVAFAIDGVAPDNARVVSGEYSLARPMYVVHRNNGNPYLDAFLEYLLGAEGQAVVADQGYIPVGETR